MLIDANKATYRKVEQTQPGRNLPCVRAQYIGGFPVTCKSQDSWKILNGFLIKAGAPCSILIENHALSRREECGQSSPPGAQTRNKGAAPLGG